MKPNRVLLAISVALSLSAIGCVEDVGSCDDPLKGLDTVVVGKQILYGGQAIINASCATGVCHSSGARGASRHGAPEGLNFDVFPVTEGDDLTTDGTLTDTKGRTIVNLTPAAVKGLRERQRTIFEKRNDIWAQVKDGIMPPDGKFKYLQALTGIKDSSDTSPCTGAKNSYQPITTKASQDILRNWLACNTPIVEATGSDVGENQTPGQAGYQYMSCSSTPTSGDGGANPRDGGSDAGPTTKVVTLEDLQSDIFGGAACAACHPSMNPSGVTLDFSSIDKLYAALVTDTKMKCNNKPYVTPGDPTKSWFYDVLALKDPGSFRR